eukprot:9961467-Heterocapsa_arctica.AAC.1
MSPMHKDQGYDFTTARALRWKYEAEIDAARQQRDLRSRAEPPGSRAANRAQENQLTEANH